MNGGRGAYEIYFTAKRLIGFKTVRETFVLDNQHVGIL